MLGSTFCSAPRGDSYYYVQYIFCIAGLLKYFLRNIDKGGPTLFSQNALWTLFAVISRTNTARLLHTVRKMVTVRSSSHTKRAYTMICAILICLRCMLIGQERQKQERAFPGSHRSLYMNEHSKNLNHKSAADCHN